MSLYWSRLYKVNIDTYIQQRRRQGEDGGGVKEVNSPKQAESRKK